MKTYNFLHSAILIALFSTLSQANSDGIYIGVDSTVISFGKESLKVTNKDKTIKTYKDVESSHCNIQIGYQHSENNRVELYFRDRKLDTKVGDISTKTFGINYEWAFSSLSSGKVIPYALIGAGAGEVSSSKLKHLDKADVIEINFGAGIHYQFNPNIDLKIGYNHTDTAFGDFDDKNTDKMSEIGQDSIVLGIAYKF